MKAIPDISADFQRYAELVPEFQLPMSKRAAEELTALAYDKKGEALPENEAARNIALYSEGIRAKVAQLEGNALWRVKLHPVREGRREITVGSTEQEFKKAPRTELKLFQEILSSPAERMVFGRGEKFATARDIVIDPERITNTMLENLGLQEFIPAKGTKQEEKVACRAQAIPAIKEMLESLEAFTLSHETERTKLKYFRLFRIGGGENSGKVLGTQVIGNQKVLFLTDLHGASRRIDHIHDEYAEEIATLQQIQSSVRDVDVRLSSEWQQTKDPEKLAEVKAQLLGMVETLKFVSNEHKKKMRDQIAAAVDMESVYTLPEKKKLTVGGGYKVVRPAKTIVKLNPGAARARINTSPLHIGKRIQEIARIKRYLAEDQTRIETYVQAQTRPFASFYKVVRMLHEEFHIYRLDRPMSVQERKRAIANLQSLKRQCAFATTPIMQFEPYQTFAAVMVEHIDKTVEALRKAEAPEARTEAATEFTKIYLMTKIQRFYTQLQKLYTDFLSGGKMPDLGGLVSFLQRLKGMNKELAIKDVATGLETKAFDDVFGELYHLINSVSLRARKAKEAYEMTLGEEEVRPFINFMYERIRGFDFAALMDKINATPDAGSNGSPTAPETPAAPSPAAEATVESTVNGVAGAVGHALPDKAEPYFYKPED